MNWRLRCPFAHFYSTHELENTEQYPTCRQFSKYARQSLNGSPFLRPNSILIKTVLLATQI